jgi:rsbT antagonist protein RsbS
VHDNPAPVAILRQGRYLVVSIRAPLDDTQMGWFRRRLDHVLDERRVRGVLIDVGALDVLDSFGSRNICNIAEAARLQGVEAVIVGVGPHVALSLVHLGIDIREIRTALDLTDGLEAIERHRRTSVSRAPNVVRTVREDR